MSPEKVWSAPADTLESMCGRYASSASPQDLMQEFEVDDLFDGLPGPDYNVAPTVAVPAVFERRVKDTGEIRRRLAPLVWGLVPSWAKDASIGSRMINARLETVAEKPAFRRAFSARRCLLPADGFYEWYAADPPTPLHSAEAEASPESNRSSSIGATAACWSWPASTRSGVTLAKIFDDDSAWLRTCSVITTEATDAAGHIHDRMPMVITREAIEAWLDPRSQIRSVPWSFSRSPRQQALEAYAVSTDVNSVGEQQSVACRADHRRGPSRCLISRP